jgi:hypothetical protein
VTVDQADAGRELLPAGRYVSLMVQDMGVGMDAEMRKHVFEPFFSTKEAHEGAGLGLSSVFGVVQQSGGTIACDSELGRGTRFTVLLPVAVPASAVVESAASGGSRRPNLRVLFVSGHTEDVVLKDGIDRGMAFLQKPFTASGLVRKVRDVLDADPPR